MERNNIGKMLLTNKLKLFITKKRLLIWLVLVMVASFFQLGSTILAVILTVLIYALIVLLFFSEPFEKILVKLEDGRPVATNKEKERLNVLFDELKAYLNKIVPDIERYRLYIVDTSSINCHAVMFGSILVTRGALLAFDDEELKAVIIHEIAHLKNYDPVISVLVMACTSFYTLFIIMANKIITAVDNRSDTFISQLLSFFSMVLEFCTRITLFIVSIIVGADMRKREYKADRFVYECDYEEELLRVLYKIYDYEISDKKTLIARLKNTHPKTALRIEKVEALEK